MKAYDMEEFERVTVDVLKGNDLAEYIAEQVFESSSSSNPNLRDCVREQDLDCAPANKMYWPL